jgi:hypothetical protein
MIYSERWGGNTRGKIHSYMNISPPQNEAATQNKNKFLECLGKLKLLGIEVTIQNY